MTTLPLTATAADRALLGAGQDALVALDRLADAMEQDSLECARVRDWRERLRIQLERQLRERAELATGDDR